MYIRSDTMKPKYLVLNSKLMTPDFPHNIKIIRPILFLLYEESLVPSNLNSNLLRFHCAHPHVHTSPLQQIEAIVAVLNTLLEH